MIVVFGYIILQFMAWEIMFVRKTNEITDLKQKLIELSTTNSDQIKTELTQLHAKKNKQIIMIVGEGTVFLLLLLIGVYKIKQAVDKEQQLAFQQRNFFLSVTHEFKTPLAATKLQLQTLLKHQLEIEQQKDLIRSALNETDRLNSLIENLLFANQLDSGLFTFKPEKINLSELIVEVCIRYFGKEINRGELKFDLQKDIFVEVDKQAFPSVLINLISNAIKYSKEQINIQFVLKKEKENVILQIKDNGIGISDEEKKKVFDRFYRSGNEETRESKGTGLGLYITKFIVQNHNGIIQIMDNKPKGSIFEIQLNA